MKQRFKAEIHYLLLYDKPFYFRCTRAQLDGKNNRTNVSATAFVMEYFIVCSNDSCSSAAQLLFVVTCCWNHRSKQPNYRKRKTSKETLYNVILVRRKCVRSLLISLHHLTLVSSETPVRSLQWITNLITGLQSKNYKVLELCVLLSFLLLIAGVYRCFLPS